MLQYSLFIDIISQKESFERDKEMKIISAKKMSNSVSFKTKLLGLFILISALPLVLAIGLNAMNMISYAQQNMEKDSDLRNRIVQEKITQLYEKNLDVLRVLAATPITKYYLTSATDKRDVALERLIINANSILRDKNNLIITDTNGQQLFRSDGLPPVNVLQRAYFWEALSGKEAISEVVVSLATGRFISVIEVPVLDDSGKSIGLVQRDYDLSELQEFVHSLATEQNYVLILDKSGKMIAHSARRMEKEEDRTDESNYDFILRALAGESGHINTKFEGEDSLVCYSRNAITGWAVVTIQPDKYIQDKIYGRALIACSFGILMLALISMAAYMLTDKITQPLVTLSKAVLEIANTNSNRNAANLQKVTGDELQQMAVAFDAIQATHHDLRKAAEMDKLTQLYNKGSTESICRDCLKHMAEGTMSALYIIDLDHFKEANDTYGHHQGDLILQEFAKKLKGVFRANDCVGRFGGDEFVVFIENIPNNEVILRKAQQILESAKTLAVKEKNAGITASIGIAIAPQNGRDYDTLFNYADKSLYTVKNAGRNGYCCDQVTVVR